MNIIVASVLTIVLAGAVNYYRFMLNSQYNKWLFCASVLLLLIMNNLILGTPWIGLTMFVFVIVCAFSFSERGGLIAALISGFTDAIMTPNIHWQQVAFLLAGYLAVALLTSQYARFLSAEKARAQFSQEQLFRQAKELNIFRSIGTALQSTLELDRIIHIILTALTAGHGLGFNRAMLFLISKDGKYLEGKSAIGSLHAADELRIWKITTRDKMTLTDYIDRDDAANVANQALISFVQNMSIAMDSNHLLTNILRAQQPIIVDRYDNVLGVNSFVSGEFQFNQAAIVPLRNKGEVIGLIFVDNHVTRVPIATDEIERLQTLADQAALAIHHANLYMKTQELAITDGLTGLHNQRFFEEMFNTVYNSTRRTQLPLSLLVIDIDYFKNYNDYNGHLAGNDLLVELARILKQSVRKEDLTFRFGGEEFVLLLSSTQKHDALRIAEKIRKVIEDASFLHEHTQPSGNLTVSIGVASFPEDKEQPRDLFEAADLALYEAKRRGRNQVVGYEEGALWTI